MERGRRLIPAHAGKTWRDETMRSISWAHPRSRGENYFCRPMSHENEGSSPLTRGKPRGCFARPRTARLIPAHAGKTMHRMRSGSLCRAHPRSRGENYQYALNPGSSSGSSPLTRGKLLRRRRVARGGRLIPAHAGKTPDRNRPARHNRAHPRSRGENRHWCDALEKVAGSSPLTRGKLELGPQADDVPGLIPAHAGKTSRRRAPCRTRGAHPRSRGENALSPRFPVSTPGSSPLTRGKHFLTCAFIAQIDQILESLELCAFSESYSSQDVYATDAPRDRVRSIGLAPRSSRGAS